MDFARILLAVLVGTALDAWALQREPDGRWKVVCLILFISGALLAIGGKWKPWQIAAAIVLGEIVSHILYLARELQRDPTSHNLLPFELAFILVLNVFALAGAWITRQVMLHWSAKSR